MTFREFKRQVKQIPGKWKFQHKDEKVFFAVKHFYFSGQKMRDTVEIQGTEIGDIKNWRASFFRTASGPLDSLENVIGWLKEVADQIRPVGSNTP